MATAMHRLGQLVVGLVVGILALVDYSQAESSRRFDGDWTVSSHFTGLLNGCPSGIFVSKVTIKGGSIRHKGIAATVGPDGTIRGTVKFAAGRGLIRGKLTGTSGSGIISICAGQFTISR